MLKRMKTKDHWAAYSFGECCVLVLMIICAALSMFGLLAACVMALAIHSFSPLIWLIPCGVVAIVCCGGLIYVNDSENMD